jgi:hypothetical protein
VAQSDTQSQAPAVPAEPAPAPRLLDDVIGLSRELRELAHDQLQLVALETKLAAQSLMSMVALAVGIGLLLVTAWLGLMGAFVWLLNSVGVAIWLDMVAVTALNILAALITYRLILRRSASLGFPATLRSLRSLRARPDTGTGSTE